MRHYRTVNANGVTVGNHGSLLEAARVWDDDNSAVSVEELVWGVWEEVPTCELARKLREAKLYRATHQ